MSDISDIQVATYDQPRAIPERKLEVSRLGFVPFIFVNVLLLVRPGELFPAVAELRLYELSMLLCLALYWPRIVVALRWDRLKCAPITVCVVGMLPIMILSLVWNGHTEMLPTHAAEFLKILLYYLLLVVAVDSPARMRRFILALAVIITIVGAIAVGHHLEIFQVDTIKTLIDQRSNAIEGVLGSWKVVTLRRLMGVGIFADPNDLAQILAVGMVLAVYGFELSRWALTKALWVAPMVIMGAGIYYSQSRGGLLAMMAGLGILFMTRFGIKRALIVGVLFAVPMLYVFGGRQADMSTDDDSAQSRVQLWSDSIQALRENPMLGMGPGMMNEYSGQVSHNSFLSAFAESGFPGGYLFLSAYAIAIWGIFRLRRANIHVINHDLDKLTPVLVAAIVAYAVGMLSLTRNYVIPTYLMLGLATVYLRIVRTEPREEPIVCGMGLLGKTFALAVCYLLAMQLFVKMFVRWN